LLLETDTAQYRPALGGLEGNGCLLAALRTGGPCLWTNPLTTTNALRLALLTALGIVLELFVVEKDLLARGKDKLRPAVDALQYSIGEFHGRLP
jgi:hypothetical protein